MFELVRDFVMPAALSLLPAKYDTPEARAMVLAIGLQESQFLARAQRARGQRTNWIPPARGFWQFECESATREVLINPRTRPLVLPLLDLLHYPPDQNACWLALEHNDVLACLFARLNLLTCPIPNPGPEDAAIGWHIYKSTWRPGAPHPETWPENYARAWGRRGPADPATRVG